MISRGEKLSTFQHGTDTYAQHAEVRRQLIRVHASSKKPVGQVQASFSRCKSKIAHMRISSILTPVQPATLTFIPALR